MLRKTFEPRDGFDPAELRDVTTARVWYTPEVARWEVEKGARALVDGAALGDRSVGSADWLVGEVLAYGGNAVVLTPPELRKRVADRATELERELRAAASQRKAAANICYEFLKRLTLQWMPPAEPREPCIVAVGRNPLAPRFDCASGEVGVGDEVSLRVGRAAEA